MTKAVERHTKNTKLLQKSRYPTQVPPTGPRPGLAGLSFFVYLFELFKVSHAGSFLGGIAVFYRNYLYYCIGKLSHV